MSNSTAQSPGDVLNQFAEAFFTWVHNDIFPACTAGFDIIVVILGLILNILLIVSFKKRGLFNEPSSRFVFMLCIVDFLAYVVLLLPNIITAVTQKWLLSEPICKAHGYMWLVIMWLQFAFLGVLGVERTIKLTCAETTYENIFESKKKRNIITAIVWVLSFLASSAPFLKIDVIKYDFFHHGCMIDYGEQPAFLIVYFILTIVATTVCFGVCYGLIFHKRHETLKTERATMAIAKKAKGDRPEGVLTGAFQKEANAQTSGLVNTHKQKQKGNKRRRKREDHLLLEVFSDDAENPAFHLSVTYLSLWAVIVTCYFPYFFAWFFNNYNTNIWGGIFNISLLAVHTSFVIKPIIYLGHNRHYRYLTKETLPDTVRTRARSMRSSISGLADKMDQFLFKSPAYKKLDASLATHKAVLVWKKKMKKNTGLFKINEGYDDKKADEQEETTAMTDTSKHVTDDAKQDISSGTTSGTLKDAARLTLTPSGINVSTTEAVSCIERERERLRPSPLPGAPDSPEGSSGSPNNSDTTALVHNV